MNRVALAVLLAGAAACHGKVKMPTEQDARDLLRNREKPLLDLTDFVQTQLEKSNVPGGACDQPACKSAVASFESAVNSALPRFADAAGAFGIEGRLVRRDKNVAVVALPPCQRLSSIAQYYADAGEYLLAWGDNFRDKSDGQHPGVIIQWRFPYQDAEFRISACFLLDGTPRP